MEELNGHLPLKQWAEDDRPREKMMRQGRQYLSDAELLAVLLGSGSAGESALHLARKILQSAGNSLHELGKWSIRDLQRFRGIGEAKAIVILAALEIGRRRQISEAPERAQIRSSRDAFVLLEPVLADHAHEEFWVLLLNRANRVIRLERISTGGTAGTVVDAKIIFRKALENQASGIILAHNHPSGNIQPSQPDMDLTRRLREAGNFLDIAVLDHIIIGEKHFFSFADEGRL